MIRGALLLVALTACSAFGSSSSSSGDTPPPPPPAPPPPANADGATDASTGPASTKITCGETSCTAPQVCCQHQDKTLACVDVNACRSGGDIVYDCYDATFCGVGQVCCVQMASADIVAAVTCQPQAGCRTNDYVSCTPGPSAGCSCRQFDTVRPANNASPTLFVCQ